MSRGGKREGAGRPVGSVSEKGVRKQHQIRAFNEEWEIIRAFARIVKKDPGRAKQMMKEETI